MTADILKNGYVQSAFSLALGGVAAWLGYLLSVPIYPLLCPAILLSLVALMGLRITINRPVRDVAFIFLGISIGSGVDSNAIASMLTWPLAFAGLFVMLVCCILIGRQILIRWLGYDAPTAVLSASPGHLSFVLGLGIEHDCNVTRIAVIQSLRLLLLTISVPFLAALYGIDMSNALAIGEGELGLLQTILLFAVSVVTGFVFQRFNVPAAFLLAGMIVSSLGHATEWTPGALSPWIIIPSFITLGCLIASRFTGVTIRELTSAIAAGAAITIVAMITAVVFAYPVSYMIDMPWLHVIFAFAPGGLESMVILGTVLGANAGFLAASHVVRLFILSFLVPLILAQASKSKTA